MVRLLAAFVITCLMVALVDAGDPTINDLKTPKKILLITPARLKKAWEPFAEWKTKLGKRCTIVDTGAISSRFKGKDIQAKIRACVLDFIKREGPSWVILGADSLPNGKGLIPDRDTDHSGYYKYRDIPSDRYYISETNWDKNEDGVYGRWKDDKDAVSYVNPKACIARIPVREPAEAMAFTKKVIQYESKYPKGIARNFIYTCPVSGAMPKLGTSKKRVGNAWPGGNLMQFFSNKTPWDNGRTGSYDLTPDNLVKKINEGAAGKFHIHGHGFLPFWVLERNQKFTKTFVDRLRNKAPLVITSVSCFTGQYDGKKDPSITESMLRHPSGGAVAIIAPSREGIPVFHNPRKDFQLMLREGKMDGTTRFMTQFWEAGLKENITAGEAARRSATIMIPDARKTAGFHWCLCELNFLGDPTIYLRPEDPVEVDFRAPKQFEKGENSLQLKTGCPGATVCFSQKNGLYKVFTTDDMGNVRCKFTIKTASAVTIGVSGPNLNAKLFEVPVR